MAGEAYYHISYEEPDRVVRAADGAFIPLDPSNRDRQAYNDWLDEGNATGPVPEIPPPAVISGTQFINKLTFPEQIHICTGAQGDAQMLLWMIRLAAATNVSLKDPEVQGGVQSLVGTIFTKDRAAEILTPVVADPNPKQ